MRTTPVPGSRIAAGRLRGWLDRRRRVRSIADAGAAIQASMDRPEPDAMAVREACRRAVRREDGAAAELAFRRAIRLGAETWARAAGRPIGRPVASAAWAILDGAACELADGAQRIQAMAMAALPVAYSGQACHLVFAHDAQAAHAEAACGAFFTACGLRSAAVLTEADAHAQRSAYAADVVFVAARRLVADLAHDRGLERRPASGRPVGGPPLLAGLHTLLLDDIDRLCIDDAISPVSLTVADDPTAMVAAIIRAASIVSNLAEGRDYRLADDGRLNWLDPGAAVIEPSARELPPIWRVSPRRDELFAQALWVRDRLRSGFDYRVAGRGQIVFDDRLPERLPQRGFMQVWPRRSRSASRCRSHR